jgi:hypothetical protein
VEESIGEASMGRRAMAVATLAALLGPLLASVADASVASPSPYQRGDRVRPFAPPRAAVLLSFAATSVSDAPPAPDSWQPGDLIWTTEPPPVEFGLLSEGCQRVPATGFIGPGVYARTTAQYSNYWQWSSASGSQPFHWYIFTTADVLKANGYSGGGGGAATVSANNHYWKVQNQGGVPQAWNVCWSD